MSKIDHDLGPKKAHLRKKLMFVDCNGHLVQVRREKKTSIYFESLFMSYEINYRFYKENTKVSEPNSLHCVE